MAYPFDDDTADRQEGSQAVIPSAVAHGLTRVGAALLAAAQPQSGAERARYLASVGNVPAQMQEAQLNDQQQRLLGLRNRQAALQLQQDEAQQRALRGGGSGLMPTLNNDPVMATLLQAAAAGGDIATFAKLYGSLQPKVTSGGMIFDPRSGTVIDPYSGTRTSLYGGSAGAGASGNGAVGGLQRTPGIAPDAIDTGLLNRLPPQTQAMVKMWLRGDMPVPTGSALRDPRIRQELAIVGMVDPSFNAATYATRNAAAKDFAPQGKTGQAIISNNTLLQHLGSLQRSAADLHEGGVPIVNRVRNLYDSNFDANGQRAGALTEFNTERLLVAHELAKLVKGGVATEGETKDILDNIQPDAAPEQIQSAIDKFAELARARLTSQLRQYHSAMGHALPDDLAEQLNSRNGGAALDYIRNNPLPGSQRFAAMQTQRSGAAKDNVTGMLRQRAVRGDRKAQAYLRSQGISF
jgi:hypothetical protein